ADIRSAAETHRWRSDRGRCLADELVEERVKVWVNALQFWVRVVPLDDFIRRVMERDGGVEIGHHSTDLRVVEDHRVRHVSRELARARRGGLFDRCAGGIAELRFSPSRASEDRIDLVPGVDEVTRDLECVTIRK